jgi:predicted Fe-Mo cluster-binding NifX family protein
MKMCIPTINAEEQFSEVCDRFGSAPYFTIYDFEADTYETVNNSELKVSLKVSSKR